MAIFQLRYERKIPIDDTIPLSCEIETVQEINGHTEYLLRVQRGINKENYWKISRRYNEFYKLNESLRISGIELPMPGKKFFGNMRPDFIVERTQALQVFINTVLMNPILASSLPAKRFVDPESYSQSFYDHAVQHVVLCLRTDGTWTLGATMGAIGWRLRKHFFKVTPKPPDKSSNKLLVKSGSQSHQSKHFAAGGSNGSSGSIDIGTHDPNAEMVLEWLEFGPDKYVEDKELGSILKSLMGLQHPHIEPIVFASNSDSGCSIIRKFHKHGTLKDVLCMATPKNPFLSKYGNPKGRTALSMKQVATYGRQILEALIFLHSKGYAFGHLHSGNVVIVDECVKLLDIENHVVGVPAFYRPFFVQHSKIHTMETIDVYCFGHVLFEMAMGYPLQESVARQITDCPEALKHLLESILSKEACKAGLPTLEQLIGHKFFTQYATVNTNESASATDESTKPHFKLSLNAKELLKQAALKAEHRLREEQKSVKNQKRIVRVQELMLSSEEEKRKSKQRAKLEHKQSKLKQQGSIQANNGRLSLSAASSIATGTSALNLNAFNRSDSVLSPEETTLAGIKSPPTTPAAIHTTQAQQRSQDDSDDHHNNQTNAPASSMVERQASSPNISSEKGGEGEEPERSALLESICKFNRGSLRKVRSND